MAFKWKELIPRLGPSDGPVLEPSPPKADASGVPAEKSQLDEKPDEKPVATTDSDEEDRPTFEHGVEAARAMTKVWTKRHLIVAYLLIWLVSFVQAFSSGIVGTLSVYVTSSFEMHSLTPTVNIVASLLSGLIKLPYAKVMNIWGRPQAFGFMIILITLGIVLMASAQNVATYAAALAFYYVGSTGVSFTMTIFVADTSSLKSRAFLIAYSASPYFITTWTYGPAAQDVLSGIGYRWGLGLWAIVYPVVTVPLWALFYYNQRKAVRMGLVREKEEEKEARRSFGQSFIFYAKEFDVVGLLLLAAGLTLFLLSFALYSYQANQWRSPLVICFIIIGALLVILFTLWEKYLAPVTFIPWSLIANRTVFFTYTMVASIYTAWYIWDSYFYSFNVVVFRQSVTQATYIGNIYTIGSTFISLVMGVIILYNGRLKWQALYFGVPLTALGVGLMTHFRQPDQHIGYIVMCQIFVAFGGGILVICEQMTVMAVSSHENIPAVLAMEGMVAYVASSIGQTISAAMWTGIFPEKLAAYLPADAQASLADIYGSITVQSSYEPGSATRAAIDRSYGDTQRIMLITATCMYAITLGSVLMWKDVNVKNIKQIKGLVW